ncbi:hypothetical protein EV702DRAFT_1051930 [Suillus placidus]|uniref:Uncharacterized protein n=1 Tax=Suillus placidus TaxID=48579 RepID=A0A9P6ZFD6_9AGAM|nr:hypothetical protein EV702DRAFT_1051930 [Suillus placidus]
MPKEIEDLLSAKSHKFVWDNEGKNTISMDMLCTPVAKGAKAAQHSPIVKPNAKINSFLQSWSPSQKKLPSHLRRIVQTAKKYTIRWEAITINPSIARQLPVWFHIGASDDLNKLNNHLYATCLRDKHLATSVGHIETITTRNSPSHRQNKNCTCTNCSKD